MKCAAVVSVGCYSLALKVPKAISTKCVGLKRDTEESSVFFFLHIHILLYIVNVVLSETIVC